MQTGSATFTLPIFQWQDDKSRLNAVVSLNYNSGNGLKTSDVASNIGQGWNLIAGGVITRMQIGEPDDQKPRDGTVEDLYKYPAGYLYNTMSADSGCPKGLTRYPIFKDKNHLYKQNNPVAADREQDHFTFQFNGKSGVFVLSRNSDAGILLGDSKVKISFERADMPGIRTTIRSFTIQDENGLIYRFKNYYGMTKVLKSNYCDAGLTEQLQQPDFKNDGIYHEAAFEDASIVNPYIINSWYLAEIEDAFTHRKVLFSYTNRTINTQAGIDIAYHSGDKNYIILSHKISKSQTSALTSIVYPDGHQVLFNYGKERIDMSGDKALSSIDVLYKNRYLSKYQLNTTYFILNRYGTPVIDYQKQVARLCLRSIVQYGPDLKGVNEPYFFDYYLGSSAPDDFVPPPFSSVKDIWGYYNGNAGLTSNGLPISDLTKPTDQYSIGELKGLCYLRDGTSVSIVFNAKTGYAKNGLLRQIRYPTGGSLSYEYAQNMANVASQYMEVGGVHVVRTNLVDGGYGNDCDHPLVTNYNYAMENGQSSLWDMEMPLNKMSFSNHYEPESRYFKWIGLKCAYRYKYPGITGREQKSDLTIGQELLLAFSNVMDVVSTVTTAVDAITYAATVTGPAAVIIDAIGALVNIALTCIGPAPVKDYPVNMYYNTNLKDMNPLPVQFQRVEVSQGTGGNGKTVFTFTGLADYPLWEQLNDQLSMKQRFAYWVYGLPVKTTWYDVSGNKVKETENVYDFTYAKHAFVTKGYAQPSCKCVVKQSLSQNNVNWSDPAQYNATPAYQKESDVNMDVEVYDIFTGRTQLKDTYERVYKPGNALQYAQTTAHYEYHDYGAYNDNMQPFKITTTQSNGTINLKMMTYSDDYTTGALAVLNQNNVLAEPVSASLYIYENTTTTVYNNLPTKTNQVNGENFPVVSGPSLQDDEPNSYTVSGWKILSETVTEFAAVAGGNIKPYRTLVQRFNEPTYTYTLYQGPGSAANPATYKEVQSFTYDAQANMTGLKDEGSHQVSNVYGYDGKYVIASVINAETLTDKPAYTSFEDENLGGWSLTGAAAYSTMASVTGTQSFVLSGTNSLSASLNTARQYRLSFWANNSSVLVPGAQLVKWAPEIAGFTYYEYLVAPGAASVTVSGNASIDELRVYPATARMRTVTYDPLIGKTSECDENNRITYYEYDELGRLRFTKDDRRNVVKMYEYNTIKKLGGCPATYTNLAVTETFTKTNCGAGFAGTQQTYTIPAGKYQSTVSQDDVDKQVANELNTIAQQYVNDRTACIELFYNDAQSMNFAPDICETGWVADSVPYLVPANKYVSKISKADANQLAMNEVNANGQVYANAHANCVAIHDPVWEAAEGAPKQCETINGSNTGHMLMFFKDVNPNSATYNTYQWKDIGVDTVACPVSTPPPPPPPPPPPGGGTTVIGSVWITNSTFSKFNIRFDDVNHPGISYSFPVDGNMSNNIKTVPQGMYNVTIEPTSDPNVQFTCTVAGLVQYDYGPWFWYNIPVADTDVNISISNH